LGRIYRNTTNPVGARGDGRLAVRHRTSFAAGVDDRDLRVGRTPFHLARPVFLVIAERGFRQQMMAGFRAVQLDGAGEDGQVPGGGENAACCDEEH